MKRLLALCAITVAAGKAWPQVLPAEVSSFYEDWNLAVSQATLAERQRLWTSQPGSPAANDPRLLAVGDALGRIARVWKGYTPTMPIYGYTGFPVWSMRLDIRGYTWNGPDEIRLSIAAYPVDLVTPAQGSVIRGSPQGGGRLGLTHIWRRTGGRWQVEQAMGVLIGWSR